MHNDISEDSRKHGNNNSACEYSGLQRQVSSSLHQYVMKANWSKSQRMFEIMAYVNEKSPVAAAKIGVSDNTVRSMKSGASKVLYEIFGSDVFNIIRSGYVEKLVALNIKIKAMIMGYDSPQRFIPKRFIDSLTSMRESNSIYVLSELHNKLIFLSRYDIISTEAMFEGVDMEKLECVIGVMMGRYPEVSAEYRGDLICKLVKFNDKMTSFIRRDYRQYRE